MNVRVLRSARISNAHALRFYEEQEAGLGAYFLNSMMADLRSLRIYGGVHPFSHGSFQRMVCRTFPYSVYYRKTADEITVYAVLDDRRDPEWIDARLRDTAIEAPDPFEE